MTVDERREDPHGGLFVAGPASGARAPILLTHFDGAMDAGAAGSLAVMQMLRTLGGERVATFDSDQFIDYRSHRPVMTVEDWVTTGVETPEIALDLVHDDLGHPVLLLHGPEPDAKWETFTQTVAELAHDAGVEISFSIHGIPAGVPHTRPTPVHVQATDPALVPDQPQMSGTMQFPAPLSAFLQERLSTTGIEGATLLAAVPYYMADNAYPRAASALLGKLSDLGDLSLPVGDLERGATEDIAQVSALVEANPEVERTVQALERHYDAMAEEGTSPTISDGGSDDSEDRDIGDVLEAYLANQSRRAGGGTGEVVGDEAAHPLEEGPDTAPGDDEDGSADSVQDVLDRLASRHRDADDPGQAPRRPRHRVDDPWETPRDE